MIKRNHCEHGDARPLLPSKRRYALATQLTHPHWIFEAWSETGGGTMDATKRTNVNTRQDIHTGSACRSELFARSRSTAKRALHRQEKKQTRQPKIAAKCFHRSQLLPLPKTTFRNTDIHHPAGVLSSGRYRQTSQLC